MSPSSQRVTHGTDAGPGSLLGQSMGSPSWVLPEVLGTQWELHDYGG